MTLAASCNEINHNQITIDILIQDDRWEDVFTEELENGYPEQILDFIVQELGINAYIKHLDIALVLANDEIVQSLNKEYRNQDKTTNVLSFPTEELDYQNLQEIEDLDFESLGDVILSFDVVAKEAKEQGKKFIDHFTHLFIHGVLHIFGFDHMDDKEAKDMEQKEIKILKKLSIASPYE